MSDTTTTPYLHLVLPVPSQRPGPTYASDEVTAFNLLDAFAQALANAGISTAGISLSSSLEMNGQIALDVGAMQFQNLQTLYTGSQYVGTLQRSGSDWWVIQAGGVPLRWTNGSQLNFAAVSGGIGGDYGLSLASVVYNDTTKQYKFYSNGTDFTPGKMFSGDFKVVPALAGAAFGVTLKAPDGLVADKEVTLWSRTPSSTNEVVTLNSQLQLSSSRDVVCDHLSASFLTASYGAVFSGTIRGGAKDVFGDTWTIFSGGLAGFVQGVFTAAVTASFVSASQWVSTTEPYVRHGLRSQVLGAADFTTYSGSKAGLTQGSTFVYDGSTGSANFWEAGQSAVGSIEYFFAPLWVEVGDNLQDVIVRVRGGNFGQTVVQIYRVSEFGNMTRLSYVADSTVAVHGMTSSLNVASDSSSSFLLSVASTSSNGPMRLYGAKYTTYTPSR